MWMCPQIVIPLNHPQLSIIHKKQAVIATVSVCLLLAAVGLSLPNHGYLLATGGCALRILAAY